MPSHDPSIEKIAGWHAASGIPYPFPDLNGPGWLPPIETGHAVIGLKLQVEAFLWLDPNASRRERSRSFLEAEARAIEFVRRLGLDEVVAWLPPTIEPHFGPALLRRAWRRSPWPSWSRQLDAVNIGLDSTT